MLITADQVGVVSTRRGWLTISAKVIAHVAQAFRQVGQRQAGLVLLGLEGAVGQLAVGRRVKRQDRLGHLACFDQGRQQSWPFDLPRLALRQAVVLVGHRDGQPVRGDAVCSPPRAPRLTICSYRWA